MIFPSIGELATREVISIPIDLPLAEAIERLLQSDHRSIVVVDDERYRLLRIEDVLRICDADKKYRGELTLAELDLPLLPTFQRTDNILTVLERVGFSFDDLVVLDSAGELYGIVTYTDIIESVDPETLMDNFRLGDLIKITRRSRWVNKETATREVLGIIEKYDHHSTLIVEEGKPIGIVTAKDLLKLLYEGKDLDRPIKEYMSQPVVTLSYRKTIGEALRFMQEQHFNRIVTVDEKGKVVGIIKQKELVTLTYNRWVKMMKSYQEQLNRINERLKKRSETYEKLSPCMIR